MAGKRGRCPECNAILSIPGRKKRLPKGGAYGKVRGDRRIQSYGWLSGVSFLLSVTAFLFFLVFLGLGVFSLVTAVQDPGAFHGPWGMLAGFADSVKAQPFLMGAAFLLGGLAAGCLSFVLLAAVAQMLRLFISLDRSLVNISERLSRDD